MQNFVYQHPTTVIFGRHSLEQLGEQCARLGRKALLVYGQEHLQATGQYRRITSSLAAAGVTWLELGGIQPNPTLAAVRRGIELAKQQQVEMVVGVGGGSVLDSAKAVAAGACVEHDLWLFFRGKKSIRRALPVICVPTAAGSGSEYNHGLVLTNEETGQKIGLGNRHLLPALAIMDPELTLTVPWRQTFYGAVDAGSHLLELALSPEARLSPPLTEAKSADLSRQHRRGVTKQAGGESFPLQDRLAASLLKTIMAASATLREEPTDYQSRAELLWGAALALGGLNQVGRGRVTMPLHLLAHALGGRYPQVAHGAWLALLTPAWLEQVLETNGQPGPTLAAIIPAWLAWLNRMEAPGSLDQLGVRADAPELNRLLDNALAQTRQRSRAVNPAQLKAILNQLAHQQRPLGH